LADKIAEAFEKRFEQVERWGNFEGSEQLTFQEIQKRAEAGIKADAILFPVHLPNILVEKQDEKIRVEEDQSLNLKMVSAPKLVQIVKQNNPTVLLVPFKLANQDAVKVDIVRWMLNLRVGLAVYSRLGIRNKYWIIDILGNEIEVTKDQLPEKLVERVSHFLSVVRRQSRQVSHETPTVPHLEAMIDFSRKMQPAFAQIIERNVESGRWPGNFSFRCTYGFLSTRAEDGFVITKRM